MTSVSLLIWNHPGRIAAGKTPSAMVSTYEFCPTILDYLGVAAKPDSRRVSNHTLGLHAASRQVEMVTHKPQRYGWSSQSRAFSMRFRTPSARKSMDRQYGQCGETES